MEERVRIHMLWVGKSEMSRKKVEGSTKLKKDKIPRVGKTRGRRIK